MLQTSFCKLIDTQPKKTVIFDPIPTVMKHYFEQYAKQ